MRLYIYSLISCPYSIDAERILKKYKPKIIKVQRDPKEKTHYNTINGMITYPQIFLVTNEKKNERIKIGGRDDVVQLLDKLFNHKKTKYSKEEEKILSDFFHDKL
jgi:glutaredoxin